MAQSRHGSQISVNPTRCYFEQNNRQTEEKIATNVTQWMGKTFPETQTLVLKCGMWRELVNYTPSHENNADHERIAYGELKMANTYNN